MTTATTATLTDIDLTKPVQVYRNLNKPGCQFSVKQGGLVRCYVNEVVLTNVKLKHATPAQQIRVRTDVREVCQWITGMISEVWLMSPEKPVVRVSCDPKTADGFCVDGKRIDSAAFVAVSKDGCFAVLN